MENITQGDADSTAHHPSIVDRLESLFLDYGMSLSDVALALGLRVPALRAVRRAQDVTMLRPSAVVALARLTGLLDTLVTLGAAYQGRAEYPHLGDARTRASGFLEAPLPLPTGYHLRPLDLYLAGHEDAVLALAGSDEPIETVLDEYICGWRDQRSDYEVFRAEDGQLAIRERTH